MPQEAGGALRSARHFSAALEPCLTSLQFFASAAGFLQAPSYEPASRGAGERLAQPAGSMPVIAAKPEGQVALQSAQPSDNIVLLLMRQHSPSGMLRVHP